MTDVRGKVDFGIITIRADELEAVLDRFPKCGRVSGKREYNLRRVPLEEGSSYLVAVVRCIEPGQGEAQSAADDMIADLEPRWLLVVGIAGCAPTDELGLGDVIVSTRIVDFSVEAVIQDRETERALAGGPLHRKAAPLAANIPALREELGDWSAPDSIVTPRPPFELQDDMLYGDVEWKRKVRDAVLTQQGRSKPVVATGAVGSSDKLIKDADLLQVWMKAARHLRAIEMESGGVYRTVHKHDVPSLSIRGISDIVGLKRDGRWTRYACHTAAAFTWAFLRSRPIDPCDSPWDGLVTPHLEPKTESERILNSWTKLIENP